jgi:dihydroorotate dehydrogenase
MSLIPYALTRSLLFRFDPEQAHDHLMDFLARTQRTPLDHLYREPFISDPIKLAGITFPNRVGLAAGLDKNARVIDGLSAMGFGFIEVGTVTPKPQPGNPKPRMFRLPEAQALINRLGFNNGGLDSFIANVQQSTMRKTGKILGLNIGKNASTPISDASKDYVLALAGVYPYADYVTVNISSPNTQNLRELQSDRALEDLLGAIAKERARLIKQHDRQVPLFVKIAPDLDQDQIRFIASALLQFGMDGVIATNTTLDRSAIAHLQYADEAGGLSGSPVLEASNTVIRALRSELGSHYPIIGVGGILSAADALSKIKAGADMVQIYTGLIYRGAQLVTDSARLIKKYRTAQ